MANTTFSAQINSLATRVGTECKALHSKVGVLGSLTTSTKTDIVAAINEVKASATSLQGTLNTVSSTLDTVKKQQGTNTGDISTMKGNISTIQGNVSKIQAKVTELESQLGNFTQIDDTRASLTTTYSSTKVEAQITAAKAAVKQDILGGAGEAVDTLKELADLITTNKNAIDALKEIAAGHVRFDQIQELTATQQKQARDNIDAASKADVAPIAGLTSRLGAVESKATANASNMSTLKADLGDLATNFVTTFETALAGK